MPSEAFSKKWTKICLEKLSESMKNLRKRHYAAKCARKLFSNALGESQSAPEWGRIAL